MRFLHGTYAIEEPWRAMLVSPARRYESGSKRREKGLAKAGNARVRRGMIQLAWRFLIFQKGQCISPVVSDTN